MMNDKEFRQKCRKIIYHQLEELYKDIEKVEEDGFTTAYDPKDAQSVALLYIAANMPIPNVSDEKPCEICGGSQTIDCTGNDIHYFYIDSKQKQLVEVHGDSETHISIKYCPFCRRRL